MKTFNKPIPFIYIVKLYIMRHGDAKKSEPFPLSKRGRRESKKIADALSDAGVKPDEIFCSGELRAKETADIVSERLGLTYSEAWGLDPEDEPHEWLEKIGMEEGNREIMLIGHLPNLSGLISLLLVGEERDLVVLRKSAVACLEESKGSWRLSFLLTPELV